MPPTTPAGQGIAAHCRAVHEPPFSGQADQRVMSPLPENTATWPQIQHAHSTRQPGGTSIWKIPISHIASTSAEQQQHSEHQQRAPFAHHTSMNHINSICQVSRAKGTVRQQWDQETHRSMELTSHNGPSAGFGGGIDGDGAGHQLPIDGHQPEVAQAQPTAARWHRLSKQQCALIRQQVLKAGQLTNAAARRSACTTVSSNWGSRAPRNPAGTIWTQQESTKGRH